MASASSTTQTVAAAAEAGGGAPSSSGRGTSNNNNNNNNMLIPTQASRKTTKHDGSSNNNKPTTSRNNNKNNTGGRGRQRKRNNNNNKQGSNNAADSTSEGGNGNRVGAGDNLVPQKQEALSQQQNAGQNNNGGQNVTNKSKGRRRPPAKINRKPNKDNNESNTAIGQKDTTKDDPAAVLLLDGGSGGDRKEGVGGDPKKNNSKRTNKRGRRSNNNRKFPWRKHIPHGTMDPITLEELITLPYPPFALRASAPYLPVPVWPPPPTSAADNKNQNNDDGTNKNNNSRSKQEIAKERERRLLQEQWGNVITKPEGNDENNVPLHQKQQADDVNSVIINPLHLNLFDGRALAYYMVSQLQFIDPLNRRDLDREELIHLDRYLKRNGFTDLNVVEAYDTKGVSISTAGATAATAAGRMEILQQEAQVLLNALFGRGSLPAAATNSSSGGGGGGGSSNANTNSNNSGYSNPLQQQYSNYQAAQQHQQQQQERYLNQYSGTSGGYGNNNATTSSNTVMDHHNNNLGVYGDEAGGGMLVIDDDENPNLRGGGRGLRPFRAVDNNATTLWSATRITSQHGGQSAGPLQEDNFPALLATATSTSAAAAVVAPGQSALHASAPAFVPGMLPPAVGAAAAATQAKATKKPLPPASSLKFITKAVKKTTPEEAQRQFEAREEARRKALLVNLTFGSNPVSWEGDSKPPAQAAALMPTEGQLERNRVLADALGVATTNSQQTPSSRLQQSWARPTLASANVVVYPDSLILVARENMGALLKLERKWKTFLEDDKAASLPLNKMDRPMRKFVHEYSDFWKLHTESFDPEPKRYIHCVKLLDTAAPCPLLSDAAKQWRGPGTVPSSEHAFQQTAGQDTRGPPMVFDLLADAPLGPAASLQPSNDARAAALVLGERPKLELNERTLPLEMPPFQPPSAARFPEVETEEMLRRRQKKLEEQKRKQQEREELKQKTLAAAFASDSEEESLGEIDADSDWGEAEALYSGDEDTAV